MRRAPTYRGCSTTSDLRGTRPGWPPCPPILGGSHRLLRTNRLYSAGARSLANPGNPPELGAGGQLSAPTQYRDIASTAISRPVLVRWGGRRLKSAPRREGDPPPAKAGGIKGNTHGEWTSDRLDAVGQVCCARADRRLGLVMWRRLCCARRIQSVGVGAGRSGPTGRQDRAGGRRSSHGFRWGRVPATRCDQHRRLERRARSGGAIGEDLEDRCVQVGLGSQPGAPGPGWIPARCAGPRSADGRRDQRRGRLSGWGA